MEEGSDSSTDSNSHWVNVHRSPNASTATEESSLSSTESEDEKINEPASDNNPDQQSFVGRLWSSVPSWASMASKLGGSAADQAAGDSDFECFDLASHSEENKVSGRKKEKSATTLLKFVKGKWKSEDAVEDNEKRLTHDDDNASVVETVLKENSELQKRNTRLLKKLCDNEKTIKSYTSQLQNNKEEIKRLKKLSDKPRMAPVKVQAQYKVQPSYQRLADEKAALEVEVGRLNQESSKLRESLVQVTHDNSRYEARIKEFREQAEQVEIKYQVEREEKERLNSQVKHLQEQFKSLLARDEKGEVQCSDDKIQSNSVIGRLQGRIKQLNEDLTSLREHSKTQSRQMIVFRQKAELIKGERDDLRRKLIHVAAKDDESDIVQLDPKDICDLEEEIGIYKSEVDGEKQNVQQEVEKSRHLEHKINQLHHEKVHLEEQLAGYDKMNEEVGILKASATNMLKRFRSFLGKSEAEHPTSENVDLECDNITKRLSKLMEELELQKVMAEVYKKDFEEERKEREEAAKKKDEEIAEMQNQFSKTVTEKHNELQSQLEKAHKDIENVRAELENSKKLLEDALTNAEQDKEKHKLELSDMEQVLQHNQKKIQDEKARLDGKVHSLEDERAQIALERDQLRENRDKLREERDDLQKQVQDMCDENDRIFSELKAKIKEAEIQAAGKNHIENEYHHLQEQQREANCVRDALQSELTELKEQLERACADKVALEGDILAKTQQVKQYKKQVDHYKAQLQESSARIEEYQVQLEQCKHELVYCQTELRRREEYEQNTTLPQAQQHASTSLYQERHKHDGRHYNRHSDSNNSVTAQAGIGAPQDHQLNDGHMQYQQGVGGVAPSPPPMQRAGGSAVAAGNRHIHPYELLQEINLHQVTYNQGQPNTYPGGDVGHPSGGGERVPVNSPQGYGQPQPPSAATYASTYPESQNYSGMRMRLSDDIGAAVDGSECHEGSTTQLENKFDLILVDIQREIKKLRDYSKLEYSLNETRRKIGSLEVQNSTLEREVYNEKQNTRCERERAEQLKLSINQLQIKTDCLKRQLSDSDEKVKVLKDTATNMLMRCRSLQGQMEAECPLSENEYDLSSKLNEILKEVEGQKYQNEKVKIQFKKAICHLEEQLQWVNDEVIKFTSLMSKENDLLPFVPAGMNAPPIATKNIGRGAFGSVDLVEINGIHCAAKTIYGALVGGPEQEYVSSSQRKPIQDKFQQECLLICKTRHQNIVQFMGVYCHDKKNGNIVLFMEYLPIDLHNCLERFQRNDIDIQTPMKLSILIDVCSGLLHIHNFSILHRDLTARNVLLTHHLNAKISDFGSSKRCNQSQKLTQAPGALPYMPPEAKSETPSYNTALDVFSFGVLTLFIAIQTFPELPMQFIDIPRDVRKRGEEELYVRRKWISRMSDGSPLHQIVLDCLQDSPSKRPFVRVLKTHLQELYKELSNETKDKAFEQMLLYIGGVLH